MSKQHDFMLGDPDLESGHEFTVKSAYKRRHSNTMSVATTTSSSMTPLESVVRNHSTHSTSSHTDTRNSSSSGSSGGPQNFNFLSLDIRRVHSMNSSLRRSVSAPGMPLPLDRKRPSESLRFEEFGTSPRPRKGSMSDLSEIHHMKGASEGLLGVLGESHRPTKAKVLITVGVSVSIAMTLGIVVACAYRKWQIVWTLLLPECLTLVALVNYRRTPELCYLQWIVLLDLLLLPFGLQLLTDQFTRGGVIILWSFLCPLLALIVGSVKGAIKWFVAFFCLGILMVIFDETGIEERAGLVQIPEAVASVLTFIDTFATLLITFFSMLYVVHELERTLRVKDGLLQSMFPDSVVEKFIQNKIGDDGVIETVPNCTIVFIDLVGFTQIAGSMSPENLVSLLNAVFSEFDRLARHYGVEKVKTIGDAYMAAHGLTRGGPDCTHDSEHDHDRDHHDPSVVADMALAMIPAIRRIGKRKNVPNLNVRIGIASGTVVAGVIGKCKFAYDLWGDAVNIASRMESTGAPGQIHCSENIYKALKSKYSFECRGVTQVKGKGDMVTYYLRGRVDNLQGVPNPMFYGEGLWEAAGEKRLISPGFYGHRVISQRSPSSSTPDGVDKDDNVKELFHATDLTPKVIPHYEELSSPGEPVDTDPIPFSVLDDIEPSQSQPLEHFTVVIEPTDGSKPTSPVDDTTPPITPPIDSNPSSPVLITPPNTTPTFSTTISNDQKVTEQPDHFLSPPVSSPSLESQLAGSLTVSEPESPRSERNGVSRKKIWRNQSGTKSDDLVTVKRLEETQKDDSEDNQKKQSSDEGHPPIRREKEKEFEKKRRRRKRRRSLHHRKGSILLRRTMLSDCLPLWMFSHAEHVDLLVQMFEDLGLIRAFGIDERKLRVFCTAAIDEYQGVEGGNTNAFHNWEHAVDVCHTAYLFLRHTEAGNTLPLHVQLALLTAALGHDMGHPGLNNAFQQKAKTPLFILYGNELDEKQASSVLEHYHLSRIFATLNRPNANFLHNITYNPRYCRKEEEKETKEDVKIKEKLAPTQFKTSLALKSEILRLIKVAILATDMAQHMRFVEMMAKLDLNQMHLKENQESLLCMLLKCADVSNTVKPSGLAKVWGERVMTEFYAQGDLEKHEQLLPVSPLCDRERDSDIPTIQMGFIKFLKPMWRAMADKMQGFEVFYKQTERNIAMWEEEKRKADIVSLAKPTQTPIAPPTPIKHSQSLPSHVSVFASPTTPEDGRKTL